MKSDRPLWLLDVDGVLNAVSYDPGPPWPDWQRGSARALGRAWPITWSPSVVAAITGLHRDGVVEVLWLTTWEDDAARSLGPLLGLPDFAVAGRAAEVQRSARGPHGWLGSRSGAVEQWWKLSIVRRALDPDPGRAVVWTDDDLAYEDDASDWARQRPGPTLLVAPPADTGLRPSDLAAIETFCRRYAQP